MKNLFNQKIKGKFGIFINLLLFSIISYFFFYIVEDKTYVDSVASISLFLWLPAMFFFINSLYLLQELNLNKNITKE